MRWLPGACGSLLLVCGCSDGSDRPVCNGEAEAAVAVRLRDAVTSAPVAGATIVLSDAGGYSETMLEGLDGAYAGGFERPGTYRVDVSAAGYGPQSFVDIDAPATACGPVTQEFDVLLEPVGSPAWLFVPTGDGAEAWRVVPARVLGR